MALAAAGAWGAADIALAAAVWMRTAIIQVGIHASSSHLSAHNIASSAQQFLHFTAHAFSCAAGSTVLPALPLLCCAPVQALVQLGWVKQPRCCDLSLGKPAPALVCALILTCCWHSFTAPAPSAAFTPMCRHWCCRAG
jgi:hypothetical protein